MDILNKTTFTNGQNFKESNTSKNFLISSNVSPLSVKTEEFSEASKRHEEVKSPTVRVWARVRNDKRTDVWF